MGITVKSSAFEAAFQARLERIAVQTRAGARSLGENIRDAAHRHIHSVSGDLASRLVIEDHLDEAAPYLVVAVDETGDDDPHAAFTEFGTVNEAPHPFMRPAIEEARQSFHVEP